MAYVPGFDHDVFISYKHDDNLAAYGETGWVTLFHACLTGLLKPRLRGDREVVVWRDPRIDSNDVLDETLDSTVSKAAVLICVMSPPYLKSGWCRRELLTFWNSRHQGFKPQLENKLRVFKVLVQAKDAVHGAEREWSEYPEEISKTMGREFFDAVPANDRFTQLALPRGINHEDQRFSIRMEKLASEVAALLNRMRTMIEQRDRTFDDAPIARKSFIGTIYLAEVTDDLDDDRYKLQQELERGRVRVLPEHPLSNNRVEAEAEIRAALSEASFAVHMLSDKFGKTLRDDRSCTLPVLQHRLAREHAAGRPHFHRIVWIAEHVDHDKLDGPQRGFLDEVADEPEGSAPVDLQEGPFVRLRESVLKRLKKPSRPSMPNRKRLIYVTGLDADLRSPDAVELIKFVKERFDVFPNEIRDDDEKLEEQHNRYCALSDGVLLMYGNAPPAWVKNKAFDVRTLAQRRREKPLAAAVYETPPADREVLPLYFDDVVVLDGRKGFTPDTLEPFLERLGPSQD